MADAGAFRLPRSLSGTTAEDDPVRLLVRRLYACEDDGQALDTAATRAEVLDFQGRRWFRIWRRSSGRWTVTETWRETEV